MVPRLTEVITDLREARAVLIDKELAGSLAERSPANGGGPDGRRFAGAALAFSTGLKQLERWGVILRDLEAGICDLMGERAGEPVCLCWKLGEARIEFWHRPDDGFAGRQPLDDLIR